MKEILRRQNLRPFVFKFLLASLLCVSVKNYQRALVDETEMMGTQIENVQTIRKVALRMSPCASTPLILIFIKGKAIPLHAMEALGGRGGIASTHSRPRH
jgi:hypothetical protein